MPASGWDFEDVRDHYVRLLFGVDPSDLRARDVERYLALGRVATGEAMLRTFAEWRRPGSSCRGGLVWFARDSRPGAGWGVARFRRPAEGGVLVSEARLRPGGAPGHRRGAQRPLASRAERHL